MNKKQLQANELQVVNKKIVELITLRKKTKNDSELITYNNKLNKLYDFKYSLLMQINN